jgi:CxxC motif-containing protein (DUF1111 family)
MLCASAALVGAGCADGEVTATAGDETDIAAVLSAAGQIGGHPGDSLPGTDPTEFAAALENFSAVEEITDGLGPTFNQAACGNCHTTPVIGGSGNQIERRFGRLTNGVFYGYDDPADNQGGTLQQLFSNGTFLNGDVTCNVPVDVIPTDANVRNVGRRTTPLFGLGLVDAMPDSFFDFLAALEPASVRGVVQRVKLVFPDPRDPTQTLGGTRVGRFGLKGGVPGLTTFSADAYVNEMGITTQSCVRGDSILAFAFENNPNNAPSPAGCNGGDLKPANPPGDPQVPEFTDDAVGDCDGGRTEIQDDVHNFTTFMEHLAPVPFNVTDAGAFLRGTIQFVRVGCNNCHTLTPFITPSHPFNGVPGNYVFLPFSDFLAHDMGSLGDHIGGTGDPEAKTRLMRTSPLWGMRFNPFLLHDGRAHNATEAIMAHDGQGAAARNAFNALRASEKSDLVKFLNMI